MHRIILVAVFILVFCTAVQANTYIYKPLKLPKAEEVVSFTNGLPPAVNKRVYKKKEEIVDFLRYGTNNLDVGSWHDLESPPVKMAVGPLPLMADPCDGVFTDTSGHVYFWFLKTPSVLVLQNAEGESALIQWAPR